MDYAQFKFKLKAIEYSWRVWKRRVPKSSCMVIDAHEFNLIDQQSYLASGETLFIGLEKTQHVDSVAVKVLVKHCEDNPFLFHLYSFLGDLVQDAPILDESPL